MWKPFVACLSLLAAACGEPAHPTPPPVATVAVELPRSDASAGASTPVKAWTAPPEATAEAIQRECGPMLLKLREANGKANVDAKVIREQLRVMSDDPPLAREPFEWCKAQALADIDRMEKTAPQNVGPQATAKNVLGQIARDMVAAYESEKLDSSMNLQTHKLCPSAKPVPAKLDPKGAEWTAKETDFKDAGWTCLRFSLTGPQSFQYEVKVTANNFVIYARRAGHDAVEMRMKGVVDPATQRISIDPNVEEAKPAR